MIHGMKRTQVQIPDPRDGGGWALPAPREMGEPNVAPDRWRDLLESVAPRTGVVVAELEIVEARRAFVRNTNWRVVELRTVMDRVRGVAGDADFARVDSWARTEDLRRDARGFLPPRESPRAWPVHSVRNVAI